MNLGQQQSPQLEIELPWLVKSAGRILGPYSREQVCALLRTKELVLLDEVARPMGRWRYVRDEPLFAKIVEELRLGAYSGREDTMTSTVGTRTVTAEVEDDISRRAARSGPADFDTAADSLAEAKASGVVFAKPISPPVKTYALPGDMKALGGWGRAKSLFLTALLFLLGGTAAAVVIGMLRTQSSQKLNEEFALYYQRALTERDSGNFAEAITNLKKAHDLRPEHLGVNLALAPLLIAIDGQTVAGRRMLEKLFKQIEFTSEPSRLPPGMRVEDGLRAKTAEGLAALIEGNFDEAKKIFAEVLHLDPNFCPALANLGVVQYMRGDFLDAREKLTGAIKQNEHDDSLKLLLNLAQIEGFERKQTEASELVAVAESLTQYAQQNFDFAQEAALLAAYVGLLREQNVDALVEHLLDTPPSFSADYLHDYLVFRGPLSWESLLPRCLRLKDSAIPRRLAVNAYCLFRSGNQLESRRQMELALSRTPDDPLIRSHYALLLLEMGRAEEANVALKSLSTAKSLVLPVIARARVCEAMGDRSCAEIHYTRSLKEHPQNLEAITGLARLANLRMDRETSRKFVDLGLQLSASFLPLQREKAQLDRAQSKAQTSEK